MLGRTEESIDGYARRGIHWSAKTLTDHGPNTQEKSYGADFMGVLNVDIPGYKVDKGFQAQSKLLRGSTTIRGEDLARLRRQCDYMLKLSSDSFVFLYSEDAVAIIPAIAVRALEGNAIDVSLLYSRSLTRFFEEHFESFIGDTRIRSATPETLERLREEYRSRSLLYLRASTDRETE